MFGRARLRLRLENRAGTTNREKTPMAGSQPQAPGADQPDYAALQAEVARLRAENDQLRDASPTLVLDRPGPKRQRGRWTAAVALLVIAALLTPPALVGFWGRRTIVDSQRYLATVGPLAQSPVVQQAVATEVTDELLARVDVQGFVATNLPPQATALTPAITGAITSFVQSTVLKVIQSQQFDNLWVEVNTQVQQGVVKALNGDNTGTVTVRDGTVYLDLSVVIEAVRQALIDRGLTVFERINPPSTTGHEIVLLTSPQLDAAQQIWTFTDPIARWLLPVVFLLYLAAIMAAPQRRRMLLVSGLVVVAAMVILAAALGITRSAYVQATDGTSFAAALTVFYDTMLRYLWDSLGALATLGFAAAFFAWLAGPSQPAGWLRNLESRATTALGETAGRWEPMQRLGGLIARGRTALRTAILVIVIVVFIVGGHATWQNVVWSVLASVVAWLVIDVLAAASPAARDHLTPPPEQESTAEPALA